jgi:hypothetical protein
MKKHLLLGVAVGIGTLAFAQNGTMYNGKPMPKIKPALANKAVPYNKYRIESAVEGFQAAVQANNHQNHSIVDASRSFTNTVIGTSMYDLQTNASICNRIVLNADGTIAATWTMAHDQDAETSPNRGTGYNYFDGTNWGAAPTARIESVRCGWPNIGVTSTNGEVIVTHEASSNPGKIHVLRRPAKGTGAWTDTTLNYPDVWPRMVVSGSNGHTIHIISQTTGASASPNPPYHGQDGAIAYSRSLDGGATWDKFHSVIPEIDSSHYRGFGGDSYAMDARGDTIAIVAGGFDVDVVLLKSTDNGSTWTKTIVNQFPIPMYDAATMNTDTTNDGNADTLETNDASVAVMLDNQGKAHVWYGKMRVLEDAGGTALSYFPGTNGLYYWNETMAQPEIIAGALDIDNDGTLNISDFGTYQVGLASMPSAGIDNEGRIYLSYGGVFEGIAEEGTPGGGKSFRHTYVIRSSDGGATWTFPMDIVDPDIASGAYDYMEGVFGAVAKRVDANVHLIYQRDTSPGHALSANGVDPQSGNESEIVYVSIPTPDFDNVGIKEEKELIDNIGLYPNPASGFANLMFNLNKTEKVNVKVYSMVGQELNAFEESLPAGNNTLTINIAGYKPGVYFVKTMVQNKIATRKLVVE